MFIDLFGKGAHNKKLPEWIMDSPKEFRKGLIEGVWKGDGCLWKRKEYNGLVFELQIVARSMAHQIFDLLLAEGFRPTLSSTQRLSEVWKVRINGGQNFGNYVGWFENDFGRKRNFRIWSDGVNVYYPISSVSEEDYEGIVYDLTVEQEHNYVCHCLVKNSGEGFGIALIEAMACKVPVVGTDNTTTPEIVIDNKAGLGIKLVAEQTGSWNVERGICDIDDCADKMLELYKSEELRRTLGNNGRVAVERDYSWPIVIDKWHKLLTEKSE